MKKISNYFLAASVFVMANMPAFADESADDFELVSFLVVE